MANLQVICYGGLGCGSRTVTELANLNSLKTQKQARIVLKCFFVVSKFLLITIIISFVTDQPEITVHPQNRTRIEGDNVTLSCNVDGNPVPAVSWTRNGFHVETNSNSRISFSEGNKQLTITNVKRTDNGNYLCVANNSLGNATSDAAKLDVQCKYSIFV